LVKRRLGGVKLVISDAHEGLRLAITRVLGASWQRCRVHWMRNALAHVPKGQHTMVATAIRQAFLQADAEAAHQTWRRRRRRCWGTRFPAMFSASGTAG
jgi:transposase-like protein